MRPPGIFSAGQTCRSARAAGRRQQPRAPHKSATEPCPQYMAVAGPSSLVHALAASLGAEGDCAGRTTARRKTIFGALLRSAVSPAVTAPACRLPCAECRRLHCDAPAVAGRRDTVATCALNRSGRSRLHVMHDRHCCLRCRLSRRGRFLGKPMRGRTPGRSAVPGCVANAAWAQRLAIAAQGVWPPGPQQRPSRAWRLARKARGAIAMAASRGGGSDVAGRSGRPS